ncbi:MAG: hypothetical protein IT364_20800 [Candidatus Hydrogenedentes bacterium]|nr:hypothetical protein [Candidatus Hydrogenedentota bacterium]
MSRLAVEDKIDIGSVLFRLQVFDRTHLAGRTWLTFPASVAMDTEAGDISWIRYTWSGGDAWRVDILDANRKNTRTIIYDGDRVDTGDAIWDGRFHVQYSGTTLGSTFRGLNWPYILVSGRHLFPVSLGKDWSSDDWLFAQVIEPGDASGDGRNGLVRLRVRDNHPAFVAPPGSGQPWNAWAKRANTDMLTKLPIGEDILDLDSGHGLVPVFWQHSYNGQVVETYAWSNPIQISDGTWIPRLCSKSIPGGSTEKVWECEMLEAESEFGTISMNEPFVIRDLGSKSHVSWPREER